MVEIILSQLLDNQPYFSKVWPYMDASYFANGPAKTLFKTIKTHVDLYNKVPTKTALEVALANSKISDIELQGASKLLAELKSTPEDQNWLIKESEKYIQQQAMYNATSRIIEIQTNAELPVGKQDKRMPDIGAIPDIMRDALSICFDAELGHDWLGDYEARFQSYISKAAKIPFRIGILNKATKGGVERGTLNILMAGVNVGKSLGLCSLAADYMQSGYNVLYISMEMSEEVCAKRIDANLLDVSLDDIDDGHISWPEYKAKMEKWRKTSGLGRLKVKQYPTGGANANTFRAMLKELELKDNFIPDVIMLDYLAIAGSSRIKNFSENSYAIVKSVAEEIRGLAVETNTAWWTGAQVGRGAWDASDIDMADVAESAGLPATADFMLAIIETDELAQMGQQLIKQIKSRYGDKKHIKYSKFTLGVKKGNQRWYELDDQSKSEPTLVREVLGEMKREAGQRVVERSELDKLADEFKF
ncbi:DNA primase/helicase, phage-associated [Yersinia phage phiR1-RT]|uniref:DnaB-like replicative helicase n=1 Tax=Yersinia phage phiR1-RT TaxID=1206558 RepID=I7LH40_BPPR1|nr:DNA primase/helicase, phage-associated [Yersinia phage phiR1-RT]CCI88614.1 DNA primase/helicase, phage-associated [Yersinia phage phiR1-RT]